MRPLNFRAPSFRFRFPSIAATPRSLLALVLSLSCVPWGVDLPAGATTLPASKEKKQKPDPALKGLPITELSPDEAILHALNRLAYGPRPGDVERVRQMGLAKWIEQQLNPNSIDERARHGTGASRERRAPARRAGRWRSEQHSTRGCR